MLTQRLLDVVEEEKKTATPTSNTSSSQIHRSAFTVACDDSDDSLATTDAPTQSKSEKKNQTELDLLDVTISSSTVANSPKSAAPLNEPLISAVQNDMLDLESPPQEHPLLVAANKTLDQYITACVTVGGAVGIGFLYLVNLTMNESLKTMSLGKAMTTEFFVTTCTVGAGAGLGYLIGQKLGMFAIKEELKPKQSEPVAAPQLQYRRS